MNRVSYILILFVFLLSGSAIALDPVAPRPERQFGRLYVESPNSHDKITLTSLRGEKGKEQKVEMGKEVDVPVGDYRITVDMDHGYVYEQDVTIRPTERHEIIVPGFGNLRVNGTKGKVTVFQVGTEIKEAEFKGGEIRTLPRGDYDVKIEVGKYTLDQRVTVVTNSLREIDVKAR